MKINGIPLYKMLTTFCIVPTYDWAAFGQRVLSMVQKMLLLRGLLFIGQILYNTFKTPLFLVVAVAALTYFPDTIAWIFIKIGQIQITCFAIMLNVVMPDIFATANGDYKTWGQIWQQGVSALPADMVEVMNGIGVAELLGIVTSTLVSGAMVRLYRRVMLRAGLL